MAFYNILMALGLTIFLGVVGSPFALQDVNPAAWPMLWSILPLSDAILFLNGVLKLKQKKRKK